jgi:putative ABC transport system permease protein
MLALKELLGSILKFGLITLAIGLVVSLTMVLSAMSEGLLTGMSGAKAAIAGDALVFQKDTYPTLERSLLSADDMAAIADAPGVKSIYGVGHSFATIDADEPIDVRVFGFGGRFDQLQIVDGHGEPGSGEAVADVTARLEGIEIGDTVTLTPIDYPLTIVGFTENRRYVMAPTLFVDLPTWEELHVATVLGTGDGDEQSAPEAARMAEQFSGSASIAALELDVGTSLEDIARELGDGYTVTTPARAAREGNGMAEMILAVGGIQWVSIVIGALLVGVFFYITTLHKTGQIAAIKAIGASNAYLYRQLVLQIALIVTVAVVLGIVIALGLGSAMPPSMAFDPDPGRWLVTVGGVYVTALLGSLFSLRNILKIDPATALGRAEQ